MKDFRILPLLLFVVFAAPAGFSQRPVPSRPPASVNGSERQILNDSLALLDSLVQYNRVRDNALSVELARRALRIAAQLNTPESSAVAWNLMGIAFTAKATDSSYICYTRALKIADSAKLIHLKVHILYNLAMIHYTAQNFNTALIFLDSCIRLSRLDKDLTVAPDAYNLMGDIYDDLKNRSEAIQSYKLSLQIAKEHHDYKQMGIAMASLANLDSNNNNSIRDQKLALSCLSKRTDTEEEQAKILVNIGTMFDDPDSALLFYKSALARSENSYIPEIEISAYNNMVYAYLDKRMISTAEECITLHALPLALYTNDFDWLSAIYDTYADVLIAKGELKKAVQYQKKALESRILADQKLAGGQLRLLAALLDVKNKEIALQAREGELLTEKSRAQALKLWLATAVLMALGVLFLSVWMRQRARLKLRQGRIESAQKIIGMQENEKAAISRELHDLTGQLMAGIAGEIRSLEAPDELKTEITGRVSEVGEKMRRISHRMMRAMPEHFSFAELIRELCADTSRFTRIRISLDLEEVHPPLPPEIVHHWYRIVQELLTNASRHVGEGEIYLTFITDNKRILLWYNDHGPGFDPASLTGKTMGLNNIAERAGFLGGYAKVVSSPGKGVSWEISVPVKTADNG